MHSPGAEPDHVVDTLVIGAGQAGLATSAARICGDVARAGGGYRQAGW
ncbi:hypothetical protein [Pseudarthrobacter sp. 1C304]